MKPLRLPPGFRFIRFIPSDSELILQYLKKKINGEALPILNLIKDRDLYGNESPSQIFQTCSSCFDSSVFDNWLYFFTKIKKKSINNPSTKRIDRIVGNGTWKLQKTYNVFDEKNKSLLIGYRSAFNFVAKSKLETNNNEEEQHSWIMHEFTMKGSIWALCKLRKGNLLRESKYNDDVIPSIASKRKRVVLEVDDDDDDDDKKKKKRRTCYRGSSSKSNTTMCDEGLVVVQQQPQCVIDRQQKVVVNQCVTASISSSYPWHSESEFFQPDHQQGDACDNSFDYYRYCNPSGDDCNMASTSYPLSPLTTLDDLPSFYEANSQKPHQVCADSNLTTSSCLNECGITSMGAPTLTGVSIPDVDNFLYEDNSQQPHQVCTDNNVTPYSLSPQRTVDDLPSSYEDNSRRPDHICADSMVTTSSCLTECGTTSTSCVSNGAPTQTLTGVAIPDMDSILASLMDNQFAYNTVDEEKVWGPNDWKELELMLLSGIESF
ncbi:hypothetical protein AQUCO_04700092v1 [Aquilegia coerulea]|uniref:NAC domain-containing protein n=1 Tax=Aquilegia coerulea TaxID=218851 RepID=A0A2G5CL17_AQUCA|nr:hypothetical protein AQUCO_04700092v1 [Aquilegia coerulea]